MALAQAPPELKKRVVLVVDDEEDIRDSLATVLPHWIDSIEVVKAGSGEEGLEIAKEREVDLIITDYKMPGMDGLEFLDKARAASPETASILITAYPNLPPVREALQRARVTKMFIKPLEIPALLEAVTRALSNRPAWVD